MPKLKNSTATFWVIFNHYAKGEKYHLNFHVKTSWLFNFGNFACLEIIIIGKLDLENRLAKFVVHQQFVFDANDKNWRDKNQDFTRFWGKNQDTMIFWEIRLFQIVSRFLHYPKETSVLETKLTVRMSLVEINKKQVLEDISITSEE